MKISFSPIQFKFKNKTQERKNNKYSRISNLLNCDTISFSKKGKEMSDNKYLNLYLGGIFSKDEEERMATINNFVNLLSDSDTFFDDDLLDAAEILIDKSIEHADSDIAEPILDALNIIAIDYNLKDNINFDKLNKNYNCFNSKNLKPYVDRLLK